MRGVATENVEAGGGVPAADLLDLRFHSLTLYPDGLPAWGVSAPVGAAMSVLTASILARMLQESNCCLNLGLRGFEDWWDFVLVVGGFGGDGGDGGLGGAGPALLPPRSPSP